MFTTLHLMFEEHYNELRPGRRRDRRAHPHPRRAGARAPTGEFHGLSSIAEDTDRPDATEMIRRLVAGHEAVVRTARSVFPAVEAASDEPSADLLTQRMQVHEKTAWMLRSLLA